MIIIKYLKLIINVGLLGLGQVIIILMFIVISKLMGVIKRANFGSDKFVTRVLKLGKRKDKDRDRRKNRRKERKRKENKDIVAIITRKLHKDNKNSNKNSYLYLDKDNQTSSRTSHNKKDSNNIQQYTKIQNYLQKRTENTHNI